VADNFCQEDIKPAGSQPCNQMTCYRDYKSCGWMPDIPVELAYRGYLLQVQDEDNPDAYRNVSLTCEVDKSQSTPIEKAAVGCERVHFDFEEDKKSYGGSKWVVSETGETLTSCLEDRDIVYGWDLVPAGWDDRDADLISYQKRQYVIDVNGQTLPMTMPAIHEGEEPVDYQLVDTRNAGFDDYFYDEADPCIKYQKSHEVREYERPDGSTYTYISDDPGEPIRIGNMCENIVEWSAPSNSNWGVSFGYGHNSPIPTGNSSYYLGPSARCGTSQAFRANWYQAGSDGDTVCNRNYVKAANHCSYTSAVATRKTVREDGEVFGTSEQKTCTLTASARSVYTSTPDRSCDSTARYLAPGYAAYPVMGNTQKAACLDAWGWR
jgi:hypothetical protein